LDDGIQLGPLDNEEGRTKARHLVDEAITAGARPVTGGTVPDCAAFSGRLEQAWSG
jgi:acyl-CoA reductase-like NAD-dependent aldehyde dehydrogenase